ncbi:hypothetical protein phiGT1_57 [Sulfitobacter phage phiGT1]|nr:hypothetical protein phiGT1_57 [Sulfitobacter phage phiGT1]
MFKIEKNIPMKALTSKYPFSEMVSGDSFFVPLDSDDKNEIIAQRNRLASGANFAFGPKQASIRKCNENGVVGFRVWRK